MRRRDREKFSTSILATRPLSSYSSVLDSFGVVGGTARDAFKILKQAVNLLTATPNGLAET
jgi:hypothetical protein